MNESLFKKANSGSHEWMIIIYDYNFYDLLLNFDTFVDTLFKLNKNNLYSVIVAIEFNAEFNYFSV